MSLPKSKFLTREEYLAIERQAEEKSEFWDGEMFLMAGASEAHNLIVLNVGGELRQQLKERPCKVYPSDLRVRIPNTDRYVYPDVSVVCGKTQFEDEERDILLNPTVIVEVLSDSTEASDRGKKFDNYLTIHSLREYLMIAQDEPRVYHFVRQADNRWLFSEASQLDNVIRLDSIGCQLTFVEIYRNVELSSSGQGEDVAPNGASSDAGGHRGPPRQ
jgi:Uma2 family endonuclease